MHLEEQSMKKEYVSQMDHLSRTKAGASITKDWKAVPQRGPSADADALNNVEDALNEELLSVITQMYDTSLRLANEQKKSDAGNTAAEANLQGITDTLERLQKQKAKLMLRLQNVQDGLKAQ
jgi:hypothetical protein